MRASPLCFTEGQGERERAREGKQEREGRRVHITGGWSNEERGGGGGASAQ